MNGEMGAWERMNMTLFNLDIIDFLQQLSSATPNVGLDELGHLERKCRLIHSPGPRTDSVLKALNMSCEGAKRFKEDLQRAKKTLRAATSSNRPALPSYNHRANREITTVWFDAGVDERSGIFSVGMLIMDAGKTILAAGGTIIPSPGSIVAAELKCILEGIRLFKKMGGDKCVILSDSMEARLRKSLPREDVDKEIRVHWRISYRECLKNHAANIGGSVTDSCIEFMPSGEEGTLEALKCAACNCYRNFHRREHHDESVVVVHPLQLPRPRPQ
ncbi:hypothetical protein ACS0TY_013617 [Phlomoides rotata]